MKYTRYNLIKLFFCLAILLSFSSCVSDAEQLSHLSDSLKLEYITGPEINNGDVVSVWIENETSYCIIFPYDYNTKIFVEQNGAISTIPNSVNYSDKKPIQLEPKGDVFYSKSSVFIHPDTSGLSLKKSTGFYAIITGTLCNDNNAVIEKKIPFTVIP